MTNLQVLQNNTSFERDLISVGIVPQYSESIRHIGQFAASFFIPNSFVIFMIYVWFSDILKTGRNYTSANLRTKL